MPYKIGAHPDCPASKPYAVMKKADGKLMGCHMTKSDANKQMAALHAKEPAMNSERCSDILRAISLGVELRDGEGGGPVMGLHFAVFNEWTEIDSAWEGNFLERVAPGAFKKTFRENRNRMRVLFNHGADPQLGDKPMGPIETLMEDPTGEQTGKAGAYSEVPLLRDESGSVVDYLRGIVPGLRAGLYGSSFRFSVLKENFDMDAEASDYNPRGLPERTIKEARVMEFGPVTFPAYVGATAGVRDARAVSLTDWDRERYVKHQLDLLYRSGRVDALQEEPEPDSEPEPDEPEPEPTPAAESRSTQEEEEQEQPEPEKEVPWWYLTQ